MKSKQVSRISKHPKENTIENGPTPNWIETIEHPGSSRTPTTLSQRGGGRDTQTLLQGPHGKRVDQIHYLLDQVAWGTGGKNLMYRPDD